MSTATVTPLDMDTARRLAREVLAEEGRACVYAPPSNSGSNACYYAPLAKLRASGIVSEDPLPDDIRERTGCYVGRILTAHGETRHLEFMTVVSDLWNSYGTSMFTERRVMEYLLTIQRVQDPGGNWGAAYDAAEAWYHNLGPARV